MELVVWEKGAQSAEEKNIKKVKRLDTKKLNKVAQQLTLRFHLLVIAQRTA